MPWLSETAADKNFLLDWEATKFPFLEFTRALTLNDAGITFKVLHFFKKAFLQFSLTIFLEMFEIFLNRIDAERPKDDLIRLNMVKLKTLKYK